MSKVSDKKIQILKTAKDLFWKFGVKRVSVEEICKEAGVSKMTFYKFFDNKTDVAEVILRDLYDGSLKIYDELMASDLSFAEKLQKAMLMKIEAVKDFSKEFITDVYNRPELGLKKIMDEMREASISRVYDFYKQGKEQGYIRKEVNVDFILAASVNVMMLIEDKNLMAQYDSPKDFIVEAMNVFLHGILRKDA